MAEIELSLTWDYPQPLADALAQFTHETGIKVHVQVLDTTQERRQLSDFALFRRGPDVSEVGSTWLSNLVAMNALRPFHDHEVRQMGGQGLFNPAMWEVGSRGGEAMAIPWRSDVRLVYYRRDLLAQAGVDETTAFTTVDNMQETLRKLAMLSDVHPCAIPTGQNPLLLHIVAPWVWQAGGQFMSRDGRSTRFDDPEALKGMQTYFETFAPYLTPEWQNRTDSELVHHFTNGQLAVIVSGHWILDMIYVWQETKPEIAANLGVALTPGEQYTGGMHLAIWRHSRHQKEALKLVDFLTSQETQTKTIREIGYIPARQDVLAQPPYSSSPFDVVANTLQKGRAFYGAYMWGLVEDRLTTAIYELWQQFFDNPQLDIPAATAYRIQYMAERLNRTLSSS